MRRRLLPVLLAGLLLLVVAPGGAALAAADTDAADLGVIQLAVEGGEGEEAPGPEPLGPDAEENSFAPEDYEANFLWGGAVGLLGLVILVVGVIGGLYYVLVVRPNKPEVRS